MNTSKVVMNFLQGSIVTQTVLGQPTMYPAVATVEMLLHVLERDRCRQLHEVTSQLTTAVPF